MCALLCACFHACAHGWAGTWAGWGTAERSTSGAAARAQAVARCLHGRLR